MSDQVSHDPIAPYDPNSNVRGLPPINPEHARQRLEEIQDRISELAVFIEQCNAQAGMFGSKGWKSLEDGYFKPSLQRAVNWLADPEKTRTAQDIGYVQGQIAAFQALQTLPDTIRNNKESARQKVQQLVAEQEELSRAT